MLIYILEVQKKLLILFDRKKMNLLLNLSFVALIAGAMAVNLPPPKFRLHAEHFDVNKTNLTFAMIAFRGILLYSVAFSMPTSTN